MDSSCKRPRIRMNGIDQASAAPASRIFRVPRDAGGKDRHSKVITARGVRDRRVRLSVPTAIQFYDLQDRLGFDQPSKAVEWLIQAAASAIAQLPSLQSPFPNSNPELTQQHSLHAHKVFDAGPMKSASYSSTSDTSKDSVDEDVGGRGPNLTTQNSFSELLTGPGPAHLQQHLSFLEDHAAGGDCSLNFSIVSPGVAQGLNRGTLQSNSLSHLPHRRQQHLLPMLASAVEGPSIPFFFSPVATPAGGGGSADCLLPGGFDGRLQLCSGEGSWHYSDLKGKGRG